MVFKCLKNKQTNKETTKIKIKRSSERSPCDIFRYSRIVRAVANLGFRKTVLHNEHSYLVLNQDRKLDKTICITEMNVNLTVPASCFGHRIIAHWEAIVWWTLKKFIAVGSVRPNAQCLIAKETFY